jgi:hypothetical protein
LRSGKRAVEHAPSLLDPLGVPERVVLVVQEHEALVVEACLAPASCRSISASSPSASGSSGISSTSTFASRIASSQRSARGGGP